MVFGFGHMLMDGANFELVGSIAVSNGFERIVLIAIHTFLMQTFKRRFCGYTMIRRLVKSKKLNMI